MVTDWLVGRPSISVNVWATEGDETIDNRNRKNKKVMRRMKKRSCF
jgi:hypothetical protein